MGLYLSTLFSTTPLFSLVDLYFTWIIISPPLIKSFSSQSRLSNFLYKGEPSPHFRHSLLCSRYAAGLERNFEGVLNTKAFCGELLSSCLILSCTHGFHHGLLSLHLHISLESYFLSQIRSCIVLHCYHLD